MTHRLTIGGDPGQSGAIALLADGEFAGFVDMPVMPRRAGGFEVDAARLAELLRESLARHPGAFRVGVLESVGAMPKQGVTSVFRFGESFGCLKGVFGALGIPYQLVHSSRWKGVFSLRGVDKDVARTVAIQRHPRAASALSRKKDVGRADALLIATWGHLNEVVGASIERKEQASE